MAGGELTNLISPDILKKSLEKFTGRSDFRLTDDLEVNIAASGFEGLLSTVLRVKISYRFEDDDNLKSKNFFVKMLPNSEFQLKFVMERGMFEKEVLYYGEVLCMMQEMSRDKLNLPLPECYYAVSDNSEHIIVMEDLSEKGFVTPSTDCLAEGFDIAHCKLAMSCLGRIHGLGVGVDRKLSCEGGNWLSVFPSFRKESWFYSASLGEMESPAVSLTERAMKRLIELTKEGAVFTMNTKPLYKMKKVADDAWKILCELVKPTKGDVNVPSHGDFYSNNLMFKYEQNHNGGYIPVGIKIIDFQLSRYCHPSIDILFFLYLCTSKSLRDEYLDELLKVYHDSLTETLKAIGKGSSPFSLDELRTDICSKYKPFGILSGIVCVPNLLLTSDLPTAEFEELFKSGYAHIFKERFTSDPKFQSRMMELIIEFMELA